MEEVRVRTLMESETVESCMRLFADYRLPVSVALSSSLAEGEEIRYLGIVGMKADNFRGSLMLSVLTGDLALSNPVEGSSVRDWAAELSNQLAGRLKNRMLPYALDMAVSAPVVVRGQYEPPGLSNAGGRPLLFDAPTGLIMVWLELELLHGFHMSFDRDESHAAVEEGRTVMF